MMQHPLISVLCCVYNGEKYLAQALESILGQTFPDWECVLIDDGSTDSTPEILARFAARDPRLRICRNERNLGLAGSLNRALSLARGTYIVRMDADDVSRRDRLERQLAFMERHPEISLASCTVFPWDGRQVFPRPDLRLGSPDQIRALFLFFNPVAHPGVIARAQDVKRLGYDPALTCTEDLDLWLRMLEEGLSLAVQKEYLLLYRCHEGQVTANSSAAQREQYRHIIRRFYEEVLFPLEEEELSLLARGIYFRDELDLARLGRFLAKVRRATRTGGQFQDNAVRAASLEVLLEYRRAGAPISRLILPALRLGPLFLVSEFLRRRQAGREDILQQKHAAELFGNTISGGKREEKENDAN